MIIQVALEGGNIFAELMNAVRTLLRLNSSWRAARQSRSFPLAHYVFN